MLLVDTSYYTHNNYTGGKKLTQNYLGMLNKEIMAGLSSGNEVTTQ